MPSYADESFDDLLTLSGGEHASAALCAAKGVHTYVFRKLVRGFGTSIHARTIDAVADALTVAPERVEAAVRVTRALRGG
jgi:hypothetical protein